MKITVGGRELIGHATLLIPKDEAGWIEFGASNFLVRVKILFVDSADDPEPGFTLSGADDHAALTIRNWNNPLPMCIEKPAVLAEQDGKNILFQFIGDSIGSLKRIEIAFFWEEAQ